MAGCGQASDKGRRGSLQVRSVVRLVPYLLLGGLHADAFCVQTSDAVELDGQHRDDVQRGSGESNKTNLKPVLAGIDEASFAIKCSH